MLCPSIDKTCNKGKDHMFLLSLDVVVCYSSSCSRTRATGAAEREMCDVSLDGLSENL